jgi:hypothetical protein
MRLQLNLLEEHQAVGLTYPAGPFVAPGNKPRGSCSLGSFSLSAVGHLNHNRDRRSLETTRLHGLQIVSVLKGNDREDHIGTGSRLASFAESGNPPDGTAILTTSAATRSTTRAPPGNGLDKPRATVHRDSRR